MWGHKSPLTGGYGDSEVGGYWGAEIKHAGYDAVIIEGKAAEPVYVWINDSRVEIRKAAHLWGQTTGRSQEMIREELQDQLIRTALIGPAGENLVRYSCILNDLSHAAGRTGLGAVMGSKKLKALAVRSRNRPVLANPDGVKALNGWLLENMHLIKGRDQERGAPTLGKLQELGIEWVAEHIA